MNTSYMLLLFGILIVVATTAGILRAAFRREFVINEGFAGLLYHQGKLIKVLEAGRHIRWGSNFRLIQLEIRKTLLHVAGQEVLTSDNIGVKISLVLAVQLTDPLKGVKEADSAHAYVYNVAQTALRAVVAGITMDAILNQRVAIANQLKELIVSQAESVGYQVHAVEVRDVMLPAELRKAFSEVLKAKQESLAALERARGETAALRNLVNAARLVEGLPALTTLRLLQTLESTGQTVVLNDLSVLTARSKK